MGKTPFASRVSASRQPIPCFTSFAASSRVIFFSLEPRSSPSYTHCASPEPAAHLHNPLRKQGIKKQFPPDVKQFPSLTQRVTKAPNFLRATRSRMDLPPIFLSPAQPMDPCHCQHSLRPSSGKFFPGPWDLLQGKTLNRFFFIAE